MSAATTELSAPVAGPVPPVEQQQTTLKRLAIVIRDDAFDRLYSPLTFAYVAASRGIEVDILFVLWAVRVLTVEGAKSAKIDSQHAQEDEWFRAKLRHDGDPPTIGDFLKVLKQTGKVRLYGCSVAAATFGVHPSQLVPEADGIADALWFVERKALRADHCQYF
jgi:peroxiredoxin family protein